MSSPRRSARARSRTRRCVFLLCMAGVLAGASTAGAATCASQSITVAPLQSSVFYVDAAQNYLGSYVGYKVTNSGSSARSGLWMRLESFTGAAVSPANGAGTTAPLSLASLAPSAAAPAYAYLKATGATASAQTHQFVLYDGRPGAGGTEVCRDTETIAAVSDVIKAAANKVNPAALTGNPVLGGTFSIIVTGDTG